MLSQQVLHSFFHVHVLRAYSQHDVHSFQYGSEDSLQITTIGAVNKRKSWYPAEVIDSLQEVDLKMGLGRV